MSESGFSRHLIGQPMGVVDSSGVTKQRHPGGGFLTDAMRWVINACTHSESG